MKTGGKVLTAIAARGMGAEFVQRLLDNWDAVAKGSIDYPALVEMKPA